MASRKKYAVSSPKPIKDSEIYGVVQPKSSNNQYKINKEKEIRVYQDGSLEVENLIERSSDKLSFESTKGLTSFYFKKELDANTEIQLIPKNVDKVYQSSVSFKGEVNDAITVYRNEVKKFATQNLDRYRTSPKPLKKKIDKILKDKNEFIWTDDIQGSLWNQVFIDKTDVGPYNYATKLEVTKEIDFINDLIVIRTGEFITKYDRASARNCYLPNDWGIAWVSPHYTLNYSGEGNYVLSGTARYSNWTGGASIYSGQGLESKDYQVENNYDSYSLSSKFFKIPAGQKLFSGTYFWEIPKSGDPLTTQRYSDEPLYSDFYHVYTGYRTGFATGGWDGIIPSGVGISIETWSTNPKYVGFNGEITVKPVSAEDPTCTYSATCTGTASDKDYQQSIRKALKRAKKKFYKKLNAILVSKGIKSKGARQRRYDTLLERVAQDVFDGLSIVRNEQIAKVQGLESDPLGGPVYYDGTSTIYGGSHMGTLYDHGKIKEQKTDGSAGTGGQAGSSSAGSY